MTLNKKRELKELEKEEGKNLRKILGQQKSAHGTWKKKKNDDHYNYTVTITVETKAGILRTSGETGREQIDEDF